LALLDRSFARPFCALLGRAYVATLMRRKPYAFRVDSLGIELVVCFTNSALAAITPATATIEKISLKANWRRVSSATRKDPAIPPKHGTNPGVTVTDPEGRQWSVKQAPTSDRGAEGPVEVVLSRILSAVGYHQPPVYFMPTFTMTDATGTHTEPGGRFRLKAGELVRRGEWSWQQNPFVGTRPYQGLLVILLMFDSSDLKNVNNALYEMKAPGEAPRLWYVVKDLGTALGETGRISPKRSDPEIFEHVRFINGVRDGYVQFHYHGWHQELLKSISPGRRVNSTRSDSCGRHPVSHVTVKRSRKSGSL
jgi:hypothetical protein